MGEIINVNIGKAGIRIGQRFLESIAEEHFQYERDVRGRSNVFFEQTSIYTHQSRSFFIDADSMTVENINLKTKNYIIKEKNLFKGVGGNTDSFFFARSFEGSKIMDQAFDNVRKQVQKCELISGFLINSFIGGGTGGGVTSVMINKMRDYYCNLIVQEHAVLPEYNSICSPFHVYNSVFAMHTMIEYTDITFFAENAAYYHRLLLQGNLKPTMDDINQVHAQNITETTAPYRFSGYINTNQRKTCVNMVMFPRVKFMVSSFSEKSQRNYHIESAFRYKNFSKLDFFSNCPKTQGIFTIQVNCRDNFVYESEIDKKVRIWIEQKKLSTTQWLINNIHMSINQSAFYNRPTSSTIINSRQVRHTFKQMAECFTTLFRRKAFVHFYLSQGVDEMEFVEVESNLNDIISEYQPWCQGFIDQE